MLHVFIRADISCRCCNLSRSCCKRVLEINGWKNYLVAYELLYRSFVTKSSNVNYTGHLFTQRALLNVTGHKVVENRTYISENGVKKSRAFKFYIILYSKCLNANIKEKKAVRYLSLSIFYIYSNRENGKNAFPFGEMRKNGNLSL